MSYKVEYSEQYSTSHFNTAHHIIAEHDIHNISDDQIIWPCVPVTAPPTAIAAPPIIPNPSPKKTKIGGINQIRSEHETMTGMMQYSGGQLDVDDNGEEDYHEEIK